MYFSPRIVHTFATSQWITHSILTVAWLWAHQYYVWQEMFWNISTQFGFNFCWKTLRICQNINNEHILNKKSIIKNPKAKGLFLFEQENIWKFPHLGQMDKIDNLEANFCSNAGVWQKNLSTISNLDHFEYFAKKNLH